MSAVDLIVEDEAWSGLESLSRLVEAAIAAACAELADYQTGVVAILLTGDDRLTDLNKSFRGKSGPTNVLSFPGTAGMDNHLGDVAIAWGVVTREAASRNIEVRDHLRHLIIHGFLHLQGYDHVSDEDAEIMESIECRALARLDVANPYQDREGSGETSAA